MEHTRTYSWGDPRQLQDAGRGMAGGDFMRLLASEELGRMPMLATLASRFIAVGEGYVEFECGPAPFMHNPAGLVHGGVAATLLDSAAGCAVHTTLAAGTGSTTLDLSIHLLHPVPTGLGPIRAIGTVVNRGRRTALGRAEVRDGANRLLALATSSCMLLPTRA